MEQPKTKQYKLYGSKVPIWWNKMSENRPAYDYFHSFDFQWIELPINMGYVNQFRGHLVLKEDTWTYFKMVHIPTNKVTYWFVDDIIYVMEKGHNYALGLDIWSSYNMEILKNIPDNMPVGVERTHVKIENYYKYCLGGLIDDLLISGSTGSYITRFGLKGFSPFQINSGTNNQPVCLIPNDGYYQRSRSSLLDKVKGVVAAYVFTNWDRNKESGYGLRGLQYLVFPVILQEDYDVFWMNGTRALGNTERGLQRIVKKKASSFIGIFMIPPMNFNDWEFKSFTEDISGDEATGDTSVTPTYYKYYYKPIGFHSSDKDITLQGMPCVTRWKYNESPENVTVLDLNFYSMLNANTTWYGQTITPLLTFSIETPNSSHFSIKGGFTTFNGGFNIKLNDKDSMINYSGPLPANNEAYDRYLNGIRESMNTAIKVSQDNMIMGIAKGAFGISVGSAQIQASVSELAQGKFDSTGMLKGISNIGNSIFNIAGSVVNHQNTKATFEAQLKDAKNSIPESISDSNNNDIWKYHFYSSLSNSGIRYTYFNRQAVVLNNNLAFLFGVRISNMIPMSEIHAMLNNRFMPMIYIEFQKAFLETTMDQYLTKKFPTMNQTLRRALLDGFRIGYRVWKEECDLTRTYEIVVS